MHTLSRCLAHLQVFVTQQYLAIAMEYAAGGDMFEHVVRKGGLKESEARWFFQQLLVGVDYVHRMVRPSFTAAEICFVACSQAAHDTLCIQITDARPQCLSSASCSFIKRLVRHCS